MRYTITDGFDEYHIVEGDALVEFTRVDEAIGFLRGFARQPRAMDAMRGAVEGMGSSSSFGADEEEIIAEFANLLVSGRVCMVHLGEALRAVPALEPAKEPAEQSPSQPKSKPKPKEPQDAQNVDGQAQADTLKRAAEDGKPFCEECEKARQAQRQEQKQAAGAT